MKDPTVQAVLDKYKERSKVGVKKYGTTLADNKLSRLEWLIHAQEEAFDLSLYLQKLIEEETK